MLNMNSQLVVVILAVPVLQRNQLLCSKRLHYHYYYHYLFCINCVILFFRECQKEQGSSLERRGSLSGSSITLLEKILKARGKKVDKQRPLFKRPSQSLVN